MPIVEQKKLSAAEAAEQIRHGDVIGVSGFAPIGHPKVIPVALAKKAQKEHEQGKPFRVSVYVGAGIGDEIDGELSRANALEFHAPFLLNKDLRDNINAGVVYFYDTHLSYFPQSLRYGFIPRNNIAIVEASDITDDGKIFLSMSGGITATVLQMADKIFIELNQTLSKAVAELHDVYVPLNPPHRREIPLYSVRDRIGKTYVQVDPEKIAGIVVTDALDKVPDFKAIDDIVSQEIAGHIIEFLVHETKKGRLPKGLPYQSGVGNVANAVLAQMAENPQVDNVSLFTEVIQDSIFNIIDSGKLEFASGTSLFLSSAAQARFLNELDRLKDKFVIRQQEISNHPEVIRRLGVISMNTASEVDIFGNVNSTHVMGRKMMNGIGGSGDFCRNAYLPIFMTPSVAKGGKISCFVPFVSHVDHTEHDVQVLVSERGLADLRGMPPKKRAALIIEKCVHLDYQPLLRDYMKSAMNTSSHTPHNLPEAFNVYQRLEQTGTMLPPDDRGKIVNF